MEPKPTSTRRLMAVGTLRSFAGALVLAVLATFFAQLGYSDSWISLVFGIFPLLGFLLSFFMGDVASHVGRTWILRVALIFAGISYLGYFHGAAWSIVVSRIVDALSYTAATMVLLMKVEDRFPEGSRGRKTGLLLSLEHGARVIAPILAGLLAGWYVGIPFIAGAAILFVLAFSLRKARFHRKTGRLAVHPLKNLFWFWRHERIRPLLLLGPCMNLLAPVFTVFFPLYVVKEFGFSYAFVGIALGAYAFGSIFQFFFGDLIDRYGARRFIILGTLFKCSLIASLVFLVSTYVGFLLIVFLIGLGSAMWNVAAVTYLSKVAVPEHKENEMWSTYAGVARFGSAVGFPIAAWIAASLGYASVFVIFGVLGLIAVFITSVQFALLSSPKGFFA